MKNSEPGLGPKSVFDWGKGPTEAGFFLEKRILPSSRGQLKFRILEKCVSCLYDTLLLVRSS